MKLIRAAIEALRAIVLRLRRHHDGRIGDAQHERRPDQDAKRPVDAAEPADLGSALRRTMAALNDDERAMLIRKATGFSSEQVAHHYRRSAEEVETLIERVSDVVRRIMRKHL